MTPLAAGALAFVALAGDGGGESAASEALLRAPFPAPRASFFHAALDVPPLASAKTLPAGAVVGRFSSTGTHSYEKRSIDGIENHFDGAFRELFAAEGVFGLADGFELSVRSAFGGWDEHRDNFDLFDENGDFIVSDEDAHLEGKATKRHDNVTSVFLRGKLLFFEGEGGDAATSGQLSLKIPVAPDRDLSNAGTYDVNAAILETVRCGDVTFHANAGAGVPLGDETLFEDDADVELNPFLHGGIAVDWAVTGDFVLGLQFEANTSAFRDVEFLEGPAISSFAGARKFFGDGFWVEMGGGLGLASESTYEWTYLLSAGIVF